MVLIPKIENSEISESFIYLNFWWYMKLKIKKSDLKEKTLTL